MYNWRDILISAEPYHIFLKLQRLLCTTIKPLTCTVCSMKGPVLLNMVAPNNQYTLNCYIIIMRYNTQNSVNTYLQKFHHWHVKWWFLAKIMCTFLQCLILKSAPPQKCSTARLQGRFHSLLVVLSLWATKL